VPTPYLGERWTPATRAYEEERAGAWYKREEAKRRATEEAEEAAGEEPGREAQRFATEYGISPQEAMRLGGGYFTGGGGMLREGELKQLQAMSPEIKRDLSNIGFEVMREPRRMAQLQRPYVPPLYREAGITGTPSWRDWFRRRFGQLATEYVSKPFAERRPETWEEFLKQRQAQAHEEWWQRGPFARGERPRAFAPPLRTVGF